MIKPEQQETRSLVRMVTVHEDDAGQRLDNFLLREVKGVPRTRLYRALRKGEVRVNKGRIKADYRLCAGDIVRIPPLRQGTPEEQALAPQYLQRQLENRIIYESDDLLVLNKPSGLAVHGGSGLNFGMIESLRQFKPEQRYLELVHRLDRDTSGLIMVAKRPRVLRELHRQLRDKTIDKRYLALAAGRWPRSCRTVEAPLQKNVLQSGERMVRVAKEGQACVTHFRVLEHFADTTLVEASPVTGRTHQIRVHALHAGFPLLGDNKYSSDSSRALTAQLRLKRLFLHASELHLQSANGEALSFHAPLDSDLEKLLERIRN